MMTRKLVALAAVALASGCHIVAGFDALELRESAVHQWSRHLIGSESEAVTAITTTGKEVVFTGVFEKSIAMDALGGDVQLTTQVGATSDGFIGRLNSRGELTYGVPLGADQWARPLAASWPFIAGTFSGSLSGPKINSGTEKQAIFLVELDASKDGSFKQAESFSGTGFFTFDKLDVAFDDNGKNVVLGGGFGGELTIGNCPLFKSESGISNIFLAVLDAQGDCSFHIDNPTKQMQAIESVAVDLGQAVVVAGEFVGSLKMRNMQTPLVSGGGVDFFVATFNADGEHVWSKRFGNSSGIQSSARVATHLFGNVALAGYFQGSVDFGGGAITSHDGHDLFVAKFNPSGSHLWTRHFQIKRPACEATACDLDKIDVAFDGPGNVLLAGHFSGSLDLGGTLLKSAGGSDMFLAKLDTKGELLWSGRFGDKNDQCEALSCSVQVASDQSNNVLLAGLFQNAIGFGGGTMVADGDQDAFIAKFGP